MQQPAAAAALRWPTLLAPMSQAANQLVGSRRQSASAAAAHKMQNSQHQLLKTFEPKLNSHNGQKSQILRQMPIRVHQIRLL